MATQVRSGPSWFSLTAVVLCIGIICWLAFTATRKSDDENYSGKASHNENTTNIAPNQYNYPLSIPGCARFLTVETPSGLKTVDADRERNKNKVKK